MRRQRPPHWLAADSSPGRLPLPIRVQRRVVLGGGGLHFLELKFQLIQQLAAALGRGAELLMPQLGDHQLEMRHHRLGARRAGLGLAACQLLGRQGCTQLADVVQNRVGGGRHAPDSTTLAGG